jgi:hypothetical protein
VPAKFQHGVDKIIARMLWANRGLGADPAPWAAFFAGKGTKPTAAWPVYEGSEPSEPDDVITVYETTPVIDARVQVTGEEVGRLGFTVRVRGISKAAARQKAEDIRWDFQRLCNDQQVTLTNPTQQYLIPCISQATVVPFGKMQSPSGLALWLVNVNCMAPILPYPIQG